MGPGLRGPLAPVPWIGCASPCLVVLNIGMRRGEKNTLALCREFGYITPLSGLRLYHTFLGGRGMKAHERTATRTATGLIRTGTQWTQARLRYPENRINKRNFRMQWDRLGRAQANS